jgi:hypothetical protein
MKSESMGSSIRSVPMIGYAKAAEVVPTVFFTILVLGFYMAHYFWSTGFFTGAFTPLLAVVFFAAVLSTIATAAGKALTPRKEIVALVELIGAVLLAVTAYWFFVAFPLDFVHVADVVSVQLQFLLTWMTNEIGRIIVAIVMLASMIALGVDAVKLVWRVYVRPTASAQRL